MGSIRPPEAHHKVNPLVRLVCGTTLDNDDVEEVVSRSSFDEVLMAPSEIAPLRNDLRVNSPLGGLLFMPSGPFICSALAEWFQSYTPCLAASSMAVINVSISSMVVNTLGVMRMHENSPSTNRGRT